jgi:hypothetical protein
MAQATEAEERAPLGPIPNAVRDSILLLSSSLNASKAAQEEAAEEAAERHLLQARQAAAASGVQPPGPAWQRGSAPAGWGDE